MHNAGRQESLRTLTPPVPRFAAVCVFVLLGCLGAIAAKGLALAERQSDGKWMVKTLAQDTPGKMSPVEYEAFVADLVNFLDYIAEPVRNERINIGIVVMIYLGLLFAFTYALKRSYWKDIH